MTATDPLNTIAAHALAMLDLALPADCLAGVAAQLAALHEQAARLMADDA